MRFELQKVKVNSFWFYQFVGWLIYYAGIVLRLFSSQVLPSKRLLSETLECGIGFVLTLILRIYYKKLKYKTTTTSFIFLNLFLSSIIISIVWHILNTIIIRPDYIENLLELNAFTNWISVLIPITLGWSALYFGIKFRLEWELEKDRADKSKMLSQQSQLQMLRYQLNPHFLFNALNSIRALIDEDTKNAKTMVTELSEFLRYSLISRNHTVVPLREELNATKRYLSIEKKRYEEKLEINYKVSSEAEEYTVLSFLIHPLVENAVKYGMKTSTMPLKISIEAEVIDCSLKISIINSGLWLTSKNGHEKTMDGTGTGLENVLARLQNEVSTKYSLETFEKDGNVHVVLEINNKKLEKK